MSRSPANSYAETKGVGALSEVPSVNVEYEELAKLNRRERLKYIGKRLAQANISAFASAMIMHRLLDYGFEAIGAKSEKAEAARDVIHSLINLYEADRIMRSLVRIERHDNLVHFDEFDAVRDQIKLHMASTYFDDGTIIGHESFDGYCYDALSYKDLALALMDLSPKVAEEFKVEVLYKEHIEDDKEDKYLFFVKTEVVFGLLVERISSRRFGDYDIYGDTMRVTLFVDRAAGFLGDAMAAITPQLTRIVRANFLAQLKPEKNLIELEDHVTRIVLRRQSLSSLPNIDVDEITKSIAVALKHKKRRVISIVGDAGLGKTEAMHSIINAFKSVPTFIVTPSASGSSPSPASIKSIFDAVKVVDSIVVFDDFEGFDVAEKNPVTNEFLRQLDGSSGFNGVALLIVNDPSKVDPLIINRPGRTDSVYAVNYLKTFEDITGAIKQKFGVTLDKAFAKPAEKMAELKFSTARIIRAYEFAVEHFSEDISTVTPANLDEAVNRVHEFEKIALSRAVRGRLVYDADAEVTDVKPSGIPTPGHKLKRLPLRVRNRRLDDLAAVAEAEEPPVTGRGRRL